LDLYIDLQYYIDSKTILSGDNMDSLSKEKLDYYKYKQKFTNQKISSLTGIPISNIDKIFGGYNKNPTLDTIKKIAEILECSIDDLIDYEEEQTSPYNIDKITLQLSKVIYERPILKDLFEIIKDFDPEDIKLITTISKRLQK